MNSSDTFGYRAASLPPGQTKKRQTHNVSKIHTAAPQKDNDEMRYARSAFTTKEARNQNMADAFYQGGHSQTAIALAFNVSGSTVSRVVLRYEPGK